MTVMENKKVVECVDCGTEVVVSKFASAKLTRCPDCKFNSKSTGKRKRPTQAVKGTKTWAIDLFRAEEEIYDVFNSAIDRAIDDKVVKAGFMLVYSKGCQTAWKWMYGMLEDDKHCKLYGIGRKKAKIWDYQYFTGQMRKYRQEAFDKLEEAGARFTWDEWLAGRLGVIGDGNLDQYIEEYMKDEIACHIANGTERESLAVMSIADNYYDEYADYCHKHGHERA